MSIKQCCLYGLKSLQGEINTPSLIGYTEEKEMEYFSILTKIHNYVLEGKRAIKW